MSNIKRHSKIKTLSDKEKQILMIENRRRGVIYPDDSKIYDLIKLIQSIDYKGWKYESVVPKGEYVAFMAPMIKKYTIRVYFMTKSPIKISENFVEIFFDYSSPMSEYKYLTKDTPLFFPRNKLTREIKKYINSLSE